MQKKIELPVSQIWALMTEFLTLTHFEENSTPTVALESKMNSSLVKRERILVFPTLESPIKTTSDYQNPFLITFIKIIVMIVHAHFQKRVGN